MPIIIRDFEDQDAKQTAQLFFDSVRHGTQNFYSEVERVAWAPVIPAIPGWRSRLQSQITFIAEIDGEIVGFVSFQDNGYIDLMFVGPQQMGRGIGRALYNKLAARADELGIDELTTQSSLVAKGFFSAFGWQVKKRQQIMRGTVTLVNFVMSKPLHQTHSLHP